MHRLRRSGHAIDVLGREKLYHIGIGRTHAGTRILLLIQDLHVRVINAATGQLLRELTLNPARNYQPTGNLTRRPQCRFAIIPMS